MKRRSFITTLLGLVGSGTVSASYASSQSKPEPLLIQQSNVSGFQYHNGAKLYSEFKLGDTLILKRAPQNPFDKHAVEVHWRSHMIGHIPSIQNTAISQMMDRGEQLTANISQLKQTDIPWQKLELAVYSDSNAQQGRYD